MTISLHPERPSDADAVRDIQIAAFEHHPFSHQTEHLIVDALRAAGALSVSLVAEVDGVIRGHVAFSPAVVGDDSEGWYAAGPIGVEPAFQRRGVGVALMEAGLGALRELGAKGCVLVGDPAYYERFGFRHPDGLTSHDVPAEYVLGVSFGAEPPAGEVVFHPGFWVAADDDRRDGPEEPA